MTNETGSTVDGDDPDTQWTPVAREAYITAARQFVDAVEAHVARTLARHGRQAEMVPYFDSVDGVQGAARAFIDAEFDWCGSMPLQLLSPDESDEDDDWDEDDSDDAATPVLSLVGRWDYTVTDEPALVMRGREAYLETWPDDLAEDAVVAVTDAVGAARELLHSGGTDGLESAAGLEPRGFWSSVTALPAGLDEIADDDPFSYRVGGVPLDEWTPPDERSETS